MIMKQTIKQVIFHQYGNPEVLEQIETELPSPGPGEVRVKVRAAGINYSDILRRQNRYFMPTPLPFAPGAEVAGVIEAAGEGVSEPYAIGTRVLAILPQGGGYATHVKAIAQYCVPLPPVIDDATATAIFVQGSTAQLMIDLLAGKLEGKTVLVNAAAGGVGSILVQLAKQAGATVIGAVGNAAKFDIAASLGADKVIDYSKPHWAEAVREATDGRGVDLVFEMVGGDVYNESLVCLADGGHLIIYGCASGVQGNIHPEYFVDRGITQSGFNLARVIQHQTGTWQQALGKVIGLLAEGKLRIHSPNRFSLDHAADAHRQIEARNTTGKVVLIP
jgi:NADPH2:quinone reductase